MTFGPRVEERLRFVEIGLNAWIEEQLAYESIDDSSLGWRLQNFDSLDMSATELADWSGGLFDDVDKQGVPRELAQAALIRQVYSRRQLYEVMVEFWSDHFNISTTKGDCYFLKTVDDRAVIRPCAISISSSRNRGASGAPTRAVKVTSEAVSRGPVCTG